MTFQRTIRTVASQIVKEKRGRDIKTDPESDQPPEKMQFMPPPDEDYMEVIINLLYSSFLISMF